VTESIGRPAYQQVAQDLRKRITSGEFPVGSAIPSTSKLASAYAVSITVVRAAVTQLRADGLLIGQPGKGVFVRATPGAVAERTASLEDLTAQISELRAELRGAESARRDEVTAQLAALRQDVGLLRTHLVNLYVELDRPVPKELLAIPGAGRTLEGHGGS
jgi:GntR family transcriptional regulator